LPRGPRIDAPGAAHHVMVRGVERRALFLDDNDRLDFLHRLDRVFPETDLRCFAWALMVNHIHLVVQTGTTPLGKVMHRISTGYARYFNERYCRSGHLVQNRYKSRLAIDEGDLARLIRYVHLNPCRAGIVASLQDLRLYRWCGHGALIRAQPSRGFHSVSQARELIGFANERNLDAWMREGMLRPHTGSPTDGTSAQGTTGRAFEQLIVRICSDYGVEPWELRIGARETNACAARSEIARIATAEMKLSCRSIAKELGVSHSAAARAAKRGLRSATQHHSR
jgi:REP element-mobilizing transposase RayT